MATQPTFEQVNFRAGIIDDLAFLEGLPQRLAKLLTETDDKVAQINLDGRLSIDGKNQAVAALVQSAINTLDQWQSQAEAARKRVEDRCQAALKRTPGSVEEEILRELRLTRAWQRIERVLDGLDNQAFVRYIPDLAKKAAADGDVAALEAMAAELPSYLESRKVFMPSLSAILSEAQAPFLQPEQRTALSVQRDLEAGWPRLQAAFQMTRKALEQRSFRIAALPGWKPSESIRIEW